MSADHVMILAGEASGDAHAAEFVDRLREMRPDTRFSGMGSSAMRAAGVEVFFDSASIAVVGLVEVLRHWGDIRTAMQIVRERLETTRPDLLVLVDYPEFNLKMARRARELGIRVLFYISPQVWAWRPRRIHKIGRLIDHMAVLFRFEQQYYEAAGIPVSFVGHPLVDRVNTGIDRDAVRRRLGFSADARIVGLFPGSRQSEIQRLLPLLCDAARAIRERDPSIRFILPVAPTLAIDEIRAQVPAAQLDIQVSREPVHELVRACDAIATCSGTVTLEIALLGTPMCIVYRVSWLSYQVLSRLITIPHIGLANIVANGPVVRELLQDDASPTAIRDEILRLLDDVPYRQGVVQGLSRVRDNLGEGRGAERVAQLIISLLEDKPAAAEGAA
ncbi:MAG: lipid-A-disaccharide synthase [Gammaproteobacteria bacterium]|nr:lipid-A-disaccharide synthase [Gammaproteobacteria bacterium]